MYLGDVSDSNLEEHLNLIESGYCQCQDVDTAEKTKVPLKIMFVILIFCHHKVCCNHSQISTVLIHYNMPLYNMDFDVTQPCLGSQMVIFLQFY